MYLHRESEEQEEKIVRLTEELDSMYNSFKMEIDLKFAPKQDA